MTTSYELSLKLKELGVEQTGGEYYWAKGKLTGAIYRHHKSAENKEYDWEGYEERYTILCRAFTLGELVRDIPECRIEKFIFQDKVIFTAQIIMNEICESTISPEEAAGELLAEILSQELKQKGG